MWLGLFFFGHLLFKIINQNETKKFFLMNHGFWASVELTWLLFAFGWTQSWTHSIHLPKPKLNCPGKYVNFSHPLQNHWKKIAGKIGNQKFLNKSCNAKNCSNNCGCVFWIFNIWWIRVIFGIDGDVLWWGVVFFGFFDWLVGVWDSKEQF
jgi:hypothetical protein